jgi:hypothetical protein
MAASGGVVSGEAKFQAGSPQELFELDGTNMIYAPSRDRKRFLVGVAPAASGAAADQRGAELGG